MKCGTKELSVLLTSVHELAIRICIESLLNNRLIPKDQGKNILDSIKVSPETAFERFKTVIPDGCDNPMMRIDESMRRQLFAEMAGMFQDVMEQQLFLFDKHMEKEKDCASLEKDPILYKNEKDETGTQMRNWMAIRTGYARIYVNQLKEMVFPDTYVVCFSGNNDDSSMWGNYAENHRGVCLIYESDEIAIQYSSSVTAQKDQKNSSDMKKYVKLAPKKVVYGGDLIERNFFESLGELNITQIEGWLTGSEGISKHYDLYTGKENVWRDEYWKAAEAKTYRKLPSWSHEDEYRIKIENIFNRFEKPEDRILEYDRKALKGVIFGINTSEYDKKRIFEAIPMECDINEDFEIYQAYYDDELQKINIRKKFIILERHVGHIN